ncbi:MAG TPA: hypothetical protein VHV75_07875 [Solirubrobacteraceae bacterium]|jgi:hypothetical protein|nr:hypothetical protein [Solirubrobacteraceae bacterium]
MQYVAWLIDEAWDHRRRRHRRLAFAVLLVATIAGLWAITTSRGNRPMTGRAAPRSTVVAPGRVLSQSPDLGVKCPIANSIACDRVGLAVWLKQPAMSVTATIAGAPVALDWLGDEQLLTPGVGHRDFEGYLQPAGIVSRLHIRPVEGTEVLTRHGRTELVNSRQMWFGEGDAQPPLIRLTIHYADGRTVVTQLRVGLAAGWG